MRDGYLTMAEIKAKYPDEWVLIDRPTADRFRDVTGGVVVWHHADRDEFDRHLPDHPLADSAMLFTGTNRPEDVWVPSIWTDDLPPV